MRTVLALRLSVWGLSDGMLIGMGFLEEVFLLNYGWFVFGFVSVFIGMWENYVC